MNTSSSGNLAVILFTYYFPPDEVVGGLRLYRFYRYLVKQGVRCRVFTAAPKSGGLGADIEEIPDPFLGPRRDFGWHLERAARRFILPGGLGIRWSGRASRAALRFLADQSGPTVVLSSFPPIGAHLAAWRLARRRKLAWVADFRDPPDETHSWLEKSMLQSAAAVITNTDSAAERISTLYPRERHKIHTIWNGFDPELRIRAEPLPQRTFKLLSHVGDLYAGRNVTLILTALTRLVERGQLDANRIRLVLAGPAEATSLPSESLLALARAQGWLELIPERIPLAKARQITNTSDGVLLSQPQSSTQVPAKLFEYLQIGRPILAYIAPGSPTERILERAGIPYRCIYPGSDPQTVDQTILDFLALPSDPVEFSPWFEEHFSADRQTRELIGIMQTLV